MSPFVEPFTSVRRLERLRGLDPLANAISRSLRRVVKPGPVRDTLHGTWLGHPVHPMLTDVPIGCWTSAALLDLLPGGGAAAGTLIATGVLAAAPTALTGFVDWQEIDRPEQRAGLVHAAANAAAVLLYTASLAARGRRRRFRGRLLGFAGLGAVSLGGLIGGHLSFQRGAGVNRTAHVGDIAPGDWTRIAALDELPDRTPTVRLVDTLPVFLYRDGSSVRALVDRCSHLSGPLHEGQVEGTGSDACIVCPWHASTFRIADGEVIRGPATAPQPVLDVRLRGNSVEVRLAAR